MSFINYFNGLFEARRAEPQDDLLTELIKAEEDGDKLTEEELRSIVLLLFVAGHETTMNLIGNGLLALLRKPHQLEALRTRPDLMPGAVEELLRYDSPVRLTVRTSLADTTVAGKTVRAGDQVIALLDAANHDPAVFDSPDMLDVTRDARHHLAFGAGAHYCLGAALARAEAQVALSALIALPELELAIDEPEWRPLVTFHALQSLPVTCRPA
jgi:pimeloyl-[acyl-carrier protein] synthase